jgi:hypothetical protein
MLAGEEAQAFLSSVIFWDEKRPVAVDVLKRLDVETLAKALGRSRDLVGNGPIVPKV